MNAVRPAFREPWLWLVIAIPLATLFGGYLTLRLAYLPGESDTVPDIVVRTGQAQDVELAPDREAALRRLIVSVTVDAKTGRIEAMQDAGEALPKQSIELQFVHPLRASQDQIVTLRPTATGWQASMPKLSDGNWQLVLTDPDTNWRLVGRMAGHALDATLRPALPP